MVRDFQQGPDWIPGTITEVLGPVTYLVDTDEGHRWKRHGDQIKGWIAPTPRADLSARPDESEDTDTPPFPEDPNGEPPQITESSQAPRSSAKTQSSGLTEDTETRDPGPPNQGDPSSLNTDTTETTRRYPSRVRQPPNRYQ